MKGIFYRAALRCIFEHRTSVGTGHGGTVWLAVKQAARQWCDGVGGAGLTPYVESQGGIGLCIVTNITVHRALVAIYSVYYREIVTLLSGSLANGPASAGFIECSNFVVVEPCPVG